MNNFAISSGGIGEALERSASSLNAANNTIDESIALITASNQVVQDPAAVGQALKTISMRIRGAKTELEEAGLETEGMVESTAKLRSEILALSGVDIMLNENEFKSTYQIMDELAAKWEDLSDIQQATVTELIAGKRQGNIVSSLMTNFDTAREALDTSMNSAGSAMKEHEKWQQSLEAQINKLKASWQSLSQAFLKSDFLKAALDAIIDLVDGLTKLIDTFGALPTLLAVFGAFKGVPLIIGKITTAISALGGVGALKLKSLKDVLALLQLSFPKVTALIGKFAAALKNSFSSTDNFKKSVKGIWDAFKQHWIIAVVVAAITVLTAVFGYQSKQAEKLSKKVEELTDKYKEQHEELKKIKNDYDTSNESSMISKYEKLSKGVDHYGKNISLTAEEYSEYQDIVNKIAEQFPSLVSGYDEQGNALLSCKGNVEQLTEAYEKLIHAQNQAILTNTGDIEKDFENTLAKAGGEHWWSNGHGFWKGLFVNGADFSEHVGAGSIDFINQIGKRMFDYELKTDTAQAIQDLINAKNDSEKKEILERLKQDKYAEEELRDLLPSMGYDVGFFESPYKVLEEALEKDSAKLQEVVNNYYASFSEAVEKEKTIAQAKLSEAFDISSAISGLDYGNITEELQTLAHQTVANLDLDFFEELNEQGKTVEQWTTELLNQLNAIGKINGSDIEKAFELQTQFNGGDIDYGDYIGKLREVETIIDGLDLKDEAKTQLKISLGLDENGVVDQYDALINRLTSKEIGLNEKSARKFLDGLSAEELDVLVDIVPKLEAGTTIDKIQAMIDEQLATEFKFDITVQTEGVEALNTALAESRSAAGLTSESIKALKARYEDLDGFNAAALFEKTANGIHLNSEELSRLEERYVATNKLEIDKNLNTLITKYNDLTDEIKGCTDAQKKEELQLKANAYKNKIDELSTLASQYDGLTSAFAKWQTALDGAEEGDNYDSLYENLESIKELYDKGLVGTDKFKTAAQLMTNKDLANADIDEIVSAYKKGYPKMQRYFTEGQKGCKNFLKDVRNLNSEWAHMNKDGSWEINFNAEEVAKELGVSVDFVLQIAKKLKDYGFEVNLEDSSVDNLKTKIEKTEAKLKELGQSPVDINVDIDASSANLGKIESEIDKAKAKIKEINGSSVDPKVKTAQLEDAKAKLEALIDKKQEASQPAFMNLNTSQVNASLVDALGKIQDYQNAINEVNKLTELKEAGIAIDDSQLKTAKEKVDECAKAIQGLDGDVKVAIGLEEDGSIDSIKKAFEEGKVKIDANTDPALTKIEQLAENVERIEDKDVTINVTVNGLDQVKELNRQIDLATDIQGDIDKLSEYVENAKELSKLGNNITSYVTAEVKGNVIDTKEYKLDNLKVFGESAKEVKGLGSFTSKVTADVHGNVIETKERKLDNLKVFTDNAKDINKIGVVKSSVTADIKGNVADTKEYKIDNLKVFTDNAKDISKIGVVESKVTADVNGNVIDTREGKLDNLKVFTDSAKDVESIGNVESKVKAEIDGNVIDTREGKIDNLKVFTDNAEDIKKIGNVESTVKANIDGNVKDTREGKIDNLKVFTDSAKDVSKIGDVKSTVTAEIKGNVIETREGKLDNLKVFTDNAKDIKDIGSVSSKVNAEINGNVIETREGKLDNLKVFTDSAKDIKNIGNVSSKVNAEVGGNVIETREGRLDNLKVFTDSAKDLKKIGSIDSSVSANIGGNVIDTKESKIDNLKVFADGANELKNTGSFESKVTADIKGNVINTKERDIDNLGVFADNAKNLKPVGSFKSEVTANVHGNIINTKERKIDNLKEFYNSAKDLKDVGSFESSVTANVNGNVTDTKERKIDNLKVFSDSAKNLKDIGTVSSKVTADVDGNVLNTREGKIDNLKVYSDSAKDISKIGIVKSSVDASINGNVIDTREGKINNLKVFSDSAKDVKNVGSPTSNVTANINGNVINTSEEKIDNLGVFATNANKLKSTGNFTSSVSANVSGNVITDDSVNSDLEHFASIVSGMSNQTVTVSVTANVDSANINNAIDLLKKVSDSGVFKDYKATVQIGAKVATIDDTTVKNYNAPKKEGKVAYSVDPESSVFTWTAPDKDGVVNYSASVEALTDSQKYKTGTITYKAKISGFPVVNGTANANGSAFANGTSGKAFKQGDWGVKKATTALTGELGQELVVYKNRWYTVGDNGAEFATIPKGAIVFNHKQTEELFKNGKVTSDGGRGRALSTGTAFASGTAFADGTDFNESFDWIEVAISRLERAINHLEQTIDDSYRSWDSREKALTAKIGKLDEEISKETKAKDYYSSKASNAYNDLSSYAENLGYHNFYSTKIASGIISVQDIKDEKLAEKVKAYQDWYEKALAAEDAVIELTAEKMDSYAQYFENTISKYDGILQGFDHTETMIDEYISQAEAKGHLVSGEYYKALIKNNEDNIIPTLADKRDGMITDRNTYVNRAVLQLTSEGMSYNKALAEVLDSEEYREMSNEIDGVTQEIEAATTQTIEWQNAIRELDWEVFDLVQERISDVAEEADFLIDLMSNEKLFDDNGKMTDKGLATMGLHGQNYNTYMYAADEYGKEIAELDGQIANDPYNQDLINRRQELIELQRESILAAEDEKQAIKDLVEEGINLELDALQERIDLHNEELDSIKDLYDYQKNIQKQSEEIAALEKQRAAYLNDTSESGRAKLQEITVSLKEAKDDLQETEFDRYITQQEQLLSALYDEYSEVLNTRLDDTNALISDVISEVNANASSISSTLTQEATNVGTVLSETMKSVWGEGGSAKTILTTYGDKIVGTEGTTLYTTIDNIKKDVNAMVDDVDKEAQTKVNDDKTTTSSQTSSDNGSVKNTIGTIPQVKQKVGNNTLKGIAASIWIYGKNSGWGNNPFRENKLTATIGAANAKKVQDIVNTQGSSGGLYDFWIKNNKNLSQFKYAAFATGAKRIDEAQLAWTQENGQEFIVRPSDGAILTPIAKGDSVLTSAASSNIWDMANSPAEFIKDNLKFGATNVPNATVQSNYTQNLDKVVFNLPNVHNYEEFLSAMQKDKNFERLIKSMTIDQIVGKSSLAKGKSIR